MEAGLINEPAVGDTPKAEGKRGRDSPGTLFVSRITPLGFKEKSPDDAAYTRGICDQRFLLTTVDSYFPHVFNGKYNLATHTQVRHRNHSKFPRRH